MVLSSATLTWLSSQLALSAKPTWLMSHVPLPQQYSGHLDSGTASTLNTIIGNFPQVIGWISGHRHANIRTDMNHAKQITVGGRNIAAINGPPAGGQVGGTTVDPWDSPLHAMTLTYEPGKVTCRWRNLQSRSWDTHNGSRTKEIAISS